MNGKTRLTAYSGQEVWAQLREADSEASILAHLEEARSRGLTVSFRAGQMAFDTQALNEGMVIQVRGFDQIGEVVASTITVGALAKWGAIVARAKRAGHVPYVVVSSSETTAGGTLATNALSRFSPTCGKEGTHVVSFSLLTLAGVVLRCSRTENAELFFGVIAGFGYLGVVLEITYQLLPVGFSNIVVETEFERFSGLRSLTELLVTELEGQPASGPNRAPLEVNPLEAVALEDAHAVSAVLYMNAERQGFVMRSRYVDGDTVELKPSLFHQPSSFLHRALQALIMNDLIRPIGYELMMNLFMKSQEKSAAVDELEGFTFFQNGNDAVKRFFRGLGFPMGIRQQTYVIPVVAGDAAATRDKLASFLERADALLDARGIVPALIDVLYLPGEGEGFVFSSTRGLAGYAVTFTFEELGRVTFPEEEELMVEFSRMAFAVGGRVHLVKNVHADSAELEQSYAAGVAQMLGLKAAHDPTRLLSNGFLKRVFPSLAR
jgi:FAD/FMN-containing dehydrogenase